MAEKAAAERFTIYRELVDDDPPTRAIFEEILRDEVFHMNYTYKQLTRIAPEGYKRHVWHARAKRLWNRYLRVAAALAMVIGNFMLTAIYFVLLPVFVCLDGFTITHSAEPVALLEDAEVKRFVGEYQIPFPLLDAARATTLRITPR